MAEKNFEIKYRGKRTLTRGREQTYFFQGFTQSIIGFLGLYLLFGKTEHNLLLVLFAVNAVFGIIYLVQARCGLTILKESTHFYLESDRITFKNSFQKERSLLREQLYDVVLGDHKVVFVLENQTRCSYDFSLLPDEQIQRLKFELEKLIKG